jgi:hypothetical protein
MEQESSKETAHTYRTKSSASRAIESQLTWNANMISVLNFLLDSLTSSIETWDTFREPGGQIGYFLDPDLDHPNSAILNDLLHEIEDTFNELKQHKFELAEMKTQCTNEETNVCDTLCQRPETHTTLVFANVIPFS